MEQDKDRDGASILLNLDEADLVIKRPERDGAGQGRRYGVAQAKGVYRVTMVKQASDDNRLKRTINDRPRVDVSAQARESGLAHWYVRG